MIFRNSGVRCHFLLFSGLITVAPEWQSRMFKGVGLRVYEEECRVKGIG